MEISSDRDVERIVSEQERTGFVVVAGTNLLDRKKKNVLKSIKHYVLAIPLLTHSSYYGII